MFKYKLVFFSYLLLHFFLISCNRQTDSNDSDTNFSILNDSLSRKKNRVPFQKLKPAVGKQLNDLQSFSLIQEYMDSLNIAPTMKMEYFANVLYEQLEELNVQLPEDLKTKGVESRVVQIKNYCQNIAFETSRRIRDTTILNTKTKKLLKSYNALLVQFNETQARLPQEIEEQLKQGNQIKKDTIEGTPLF